MSEWTQEQLAEFEAAWKAANTPEARSAHWEREWRRLHRELPRRVRFRIWRGHRKTDAVHWLCRRRLYWAAEALIGMRRRRS
jgi:hypothetical protein